MSIQDLRNITNNFKDVRLISLASWRAASEFSPRDRGGPYVVTQEGLDPEDIKGTPDEFVLGRAGMWLSLRYFFGLPVAERRAQFVYGTAAEVMAAMYNLPPKVTILRPGTKVEGEPAADEMAEAIKAGKAGKPEAAG